MIGKLRDKKTLFGTWAMIPSTTVVEIIAQSGVDYIILDLEHGLMGYETIVDQVRVIELNNCQPIIRVGNDDENIILRALETGCSAIMVPHVSSAESARRIVSIARYRPDGERGLSPYTRCHGYDHNDLELSMNKNNTELFLGILIEGKDGLNNITSICDVEGIDLIYLGMYDISQSLGLPGQLDHPKVEEKLKECLEVINKSGKLPGIFVKDIKKAIHYRNSGFKFIAYIADSFALKSFYKSKVKEFKSL